MTDTFAGFDWDEGNLEKCQQHGVSILEVEGLFSRQPAVWPDLAHSQDETRLLAIGCSVKGRHIFVAFTVRVLDGERYLRPISARYMHQKEIEHYERTHPGT